MMSFEIKKIGLALCLIASLLVGHASACTCPTHETDQVNEADCTVHHESHENADAGESGNVFDDECTCVVDHPSPYVASQSSKQFKAKYNAGTPERSIPDLKLTAVVRLQDPSPEFASDLSYSHTLRSLLPSRAPPRL